MNKKINELYSILPEENKALAKLIQHTFEEIKKLEDYHRILVASNAVAGIKPDIQEELTFKETLKTVKNVLIKELEKTVEDIQHRGDKNWIKHYEDGTI